MEEEKEEVIATCWGRSPWTAKEWMDGRKLNEWTAARSRKCARQMTVALPLLRPSHHPLGPRVETLYVVEL